MYLIYDQKGRGLDLVSISPEGSSAPFLRIMESQLQKFFKPVSPTQIRQELASWVSTRSESMRLLTGVDPETLVSKINQGTEQELTGEVLKWMSAFQIAFDEWQSRVDFLRQMPDLPIDTDLPVKFRDQCANKSPKGGVGEVLGVRNENGRYVVWVEWSDGSNSDVDAEHLENI